MTEEEARAGLRKAYGATALERVDLIVAGVLDESANQNLIAPSTIGQMWVRHVWDSVQLLQWKPESAGTWLDIGTGAGFPGMIVAALCDMPVTMVEPRRRRAEFLDRLAGLVGLTNATVVNAKVESLTGKYDVISARAVASIDELFAAASHLASDATTWILPKGRSWSEELEIARRYWKGMFHVEQSLTSDEARVVIARGVTRA